MTGLYLHPLRLKALSEGRLSVLRVPFREQPGKNVARLVKSASDLHWIEQYDNGDPLGVLTGKPISWQSNGRSHKMPYAPGDHFVKETCYICRSADDGEALCNPHVVYAADGAKKSDDYPFVRTALVMPEWAARYVLTLGPPVPGRLGGLTNEDVIKEGIYDGPWPPPLSMACKTHPIDVYDDYWNTIYPRHPWHPDLWTWAYPVRRRR